MKSRNGICASLIVLLFVSSCAQMDKLKTSLVHSSANLNSSAVSGPTTGHSYYRPSAALQQENVGKKTSIKELTTDKILTGKKTKSATKVSTNKKKTAVNKNTKKVL